MNRFLLFFVMTLQAIVPPIRGAVVYEEDFSSRSKSLAKWQMKDRAEWVVDADGRLKSVNNNPKKTVGCRSPRFKQKDLRMEFDFNLQAGRELDFKINLHNGGHICRFVINPTGFMLRVNRNAQIPITEAFNMERVETRIPKKKWLRMIIEIRGDKITGAIPGKASKTYQHKYFDHPIGTFGLAAKGGTVLFDNFRITTLDNPDVAKAKPAPAPAKPQVVTEAKSVAAKPKAEWSKALAPFFDNHCYDCHDDSLSKGNLDLFALSADLSDAENLRRWVRIFDRVKAGEMPPEKKKRPEAGEKSAFLSALGEALAAGHRAEREVVLRRLNRAEYENTINDLFGIKLRLKEMFPEDAKKHGFDNNGEGLTLSSELIETYLDAANLTLDRVFGPGKKPKHVAIDSTIDKFIHDNMYNKWQKLLKTDEGTVVYSSQFGAGSQLNHFKIPSEGTYRVRFHARAYQTNGPVTMQIQSGILTRSGTKRFLGFFSIPPAGRVVELTDYMLPNESFYPRPFGTIKNISAFLGRNGGRDLNRKIADYQGPGLLIEKVEIEGPLEEWPPASRRALLGNASLENGTAADARKIFERLLPRAFRRPASSSEIAKYTGKVRELTTAGRSFEESLRWALTAMLCSPEFLFINEPASGSDGSIDDFALAARLSYFLRSSMPDQELLDLAASGKLSQPDMLRAQTERLLSDPKSSALTENFAHQWLHLRDIDATAPDTKLYPDFDEYLKTSMVRETELFFESMLRDNRSVREFIDSDWLVINERLARLYGVEGLKGEKFQRVRLAKNNVRGGLMTQASILKVTANGANTSPVTRGVWMLENIMGIHPPPPPPNVPAVVPDVSGAKTLRQLLDAHRNEPLCNSCHQIIDPPGFALESFDAIGAWRTKYRFQGSRRLLPVDASGETRDGRKFRNIHDYKRIVLGEIDQVTKGLTDKLLTYATGRAMGFSDRPNIQQIVANVGRKDYGFRELIHEAVQSPIFRQP